jgi:hypothetical protein
MPDALHVCEVVPVTAEAGDWMPLPWCEWTMIHVVPEPLHPVQVPPLEREPMHAAMHAVRVKSVPTPSPGSCASVTPGRASVTPGHASVATSAASAR